MLLCVCERAHVKAGHGLQKLDKCLTSYVLRTGVCII